MRGKASRAPCPSPRIAIALEHHIFREPLECCGASSDGGFASSGNRSRHAVSISVFTNPRAEKPACDDDEKIPPKVLGYFR